jgi:uncharacterized protein with von Willebrand factor type A (vWA) domain
MSLLDKVVAAVTPEPDDNEIAAARAQLRASGHAVAWIGMVCDHHDAIDAAFTAVRGATNATLLSGHSLAEEGVLYPALALHDHQVHATAAYTQQSAAKVQVAALEELEPLSSDYLDKLEHLRAAVVHHVFEEETKWFPELRDGCDAAIHARLSQRYSEEASRYFGSDGGTTAPSGVGGPL